MEYLEQLRELAAANNVEHRADIGAKTLIKKLKEYGVAIPPEPVSEVVEKPKSSTDKAEFNRAFSALQKAQKEFEVAVKTKSGSIEIAKHKRGQQFVLLLTKLKAGGESTNLKKFLQWARGRKIDCDRSDEYLLNKMERDAATGVALAVKQPNTALKVNIGDEVRFSTLWDEGRGKNMYTFYPVVTISPFAQETKEVAANKAQGFKPEMSEYPPAYDQYHRFQLVDTEFEKYFEVSVPVEEVED